MILKAYTVTPAVRCSRDLDLRAGIYNLKSSGLLFLGPDPVVTCGDNLRLILLSFTGPWSGQVSVG